MNSLARWIGSGATSGRAARSSRTSSARRWRPASRPASAPSAVPRSKGVVAMPSPAPTPAVSVASAGRESGTHRSPPRVRIPPSARARVSLLPLTPPETRCTRPRTRTTSKRTTHHHQPSALREASGLRAGALLRRFSHVRHHPPSRTRAPRAGDGRALRGSRQRGADCRRSRTFPRSRGS